MLSQEQNKIEDVVIGVTTNGPDDTEPLLLRTMSTIETRNNEREENRTNRDHDTTDSDDLNNNNNKRQDDVVWESLPVNDENDNNNNNNNVISAAKTSILNDDSVICTNTNTDDGHNQNIHSQQQQEHEQQVKESSLQQHPNKIMKKRLLSTTTTTTSNSCNSSSHTTNNQKMNRNDISSLCTVIEDIILQSNTNKKQYDSNTQQQQQSSSSSSSSSSSNHNQHKRHRHQQQQNHESSSSLNVWIFCFLKHWILCNLFYSNNINDNNNIDNDSNDGDIDTNKTKTNHQQQHQKFVSIRNVFMILCGIISIIAQCIEYMLYGILYPERIKMIVSCCVIIAFSTYLFIVWNQHYYNGTGSGIYNNKKKEKMTTATSKSKYNNNNPLESVFDWFSCNIYNSITILQLTMMMGIYIIPTIIEIRTIYWLIHFIVQRYETTCSSSYIFTYLSLFIPSIVLILSIRYAYYNNINNKTKNNNNNSYRIICRCYCTISSINKHILFGWCPKYCYKQIGMYILYGLSLYSILSYNNSYFMVRRHLPNLISNFFCVTTILLYRSIRSYNNSNIDITSHTIRFALRRTLQEMLQQQQQENDNRNSNNIIEANFNMKRNRTTEKVNDQQLLFITMLNWIVKYWDTSPTKSTTTTSSFSSTTTKTKNGETTVNVNETKQQRRQRKSHSLTTFQEFPDPSTSTSTQEPPYPSPSTQNPSSSSQQFSSRTKLESNINTPSTMNTSKPDDSIPQQRPTSKSEGNNIPNDSLQSLHAMLTTIDLDERAKPTVLLYKQMIQNFPPSYWMACFLGLFRRCPTILLLVVHLFGSRIMKWYSLSYITVGLLLPFVLLEVIRIRLFVRCFYQLTSHNYIMNDKAWKSQKPNPSIEPMTILLMDESYLSTQRLPTLLNVWNNILTSVEVLEMSITVTRCVQTTTVANDLVSNLILLTKFGYDVLQHGWIFGVTIIAKELIHLYTTGTDPLSLWHGTASPAGASYTSATVSLVRNADIIRRNINVLSEEEKDNIGKLIAPILGFLALIIGQGWIWGRENNTPVQASNPISKSTIEIVELTEDDADNATHIETKTVTEYDKSRLENRSDCHDNEIAQTDVSDVTRGNTLIVNNDPTNVPTVVLNNDANLSLDMEYNGAVDLTKASEVLRFDENIKSIVTTNVKEMAKDDIIDATVIDSDLIDATKSVMVVEHAVSFDNDVSEMMDLLFQCDEYGLLGTDERSLILERLAELVQGTKDSSNEWFCTIKQNLHNLLESRLIVMNNLRNLVEGKECDRSVFTLDGTPVEPIDEIQCDSTNVDNGVSHHATESASIDVDVNTISAQCDSLEATPSSIGDNCKDHTLEAIITTDTIESLDLSIDGGRGAISVSDDDLIIGRDNDKTSDSILSDRVQSPPRWPEGDDDDEFQPIENTNHVQSTLQWPEPDDDNKFNHIGSVANDNPNLVDSGANCNVDVVLNCKSNDEQENIWLKVGGGIAIIGSIVGGVVAMNAAKGRRNDRDK